MSYPSVVRQSCLQNYAIPYLMFPHRESRPIEKLRNALPPLSYDRYFARLRREFLRGLRPPQRNYAESRRVSPAQSLQSA